MIGWRDEWRLSILCPWPPRRGRSPYEVGGLVRGTRGSHESMCLLIEVLVPGLSGAAAGQLTREVAGAGLLELHAQRQPRGASGALFLVSEPRQDCACSLSADDADWDAPHYTLRPDAAERLARTLEFLLARAGPDGLAVRAAWVDDARQPLAQTATPPVAVSALLADLRRARIANSRVYRISGPAA